MQESVKQLIEAAEKALASKKPCPTMARDAMRCACWHCTLSRALRDIKREYGLETGT